MLQVENLKHQLARNESAVKRAVAAALAEKPVAEDLARRELQKELAEKLGTHFTCFNRAKVRILTQTAVRC